jgi:hypothetical protein
MPRSPTRCPSVTHYCRPGIRSISRPQASEMQPGLFPLQVNGTYPYDYAQTISKPLSLFSTQSSKLTRPQDPSWEEKTILCHCDLRGENMGIEICAACGSARGMVRDSRRIVRNDTFLLLYITESPAVLYNLFHVLLCLFMRRGP